MASYDGTSRRRREPPPGFEVMRASELDLLHGSYDRWVYRGVGVNFSRIRSGLKSRDAACLAAWVAFDEVCNRGLVNKPDLADPAGMQPVYTVRVDSWEHMEGDLLAQIVADAGSIRRASKVLDMPRSTLSTRVRAHKDRGTWPR
jgi:hypothetical protein